MGDLAAIVLAAGGSSRLGRPKQLLNLGGQSLVARAVGNALAVGCDPVIVVVGRDAQACARELPLAATVVVNDDWESGMGSSLRKGALALPVCTTRTFVLLCDQPQVNEVTLRRLRDQFDLSPVAACVSAYADTLGPPVLSNADVIDQLRNWPDREGAKRLWTADASQIATIDAPEAAIDIDTPEDVIRHLKNAAVPDDV